MRVFDPSDHLTKLTVVSYSFQASCYTVTNADRARRFNHALIFHSHPHLTSVILHTSPLILTSPRQRRLRRV